MFVILSAAKDLKLKKLMFILSMARHQKIELFFEQYYQKNLMLIFKAQTIMFCALNWAMIFPLIW